LTRTFIPALLAASSLVLAVAACSPKNPAAEATPIAETAAPEAPAAAMPESGVTDFVQKAALSDMFEIESGKILLERSKVQPVKDFAQMMIDAHTATSAELGPLATAAGVMPPTELDADHMKKLEDLRTAKMEDVDDIYIDQQTAAHSAALDLMKDYADNGKDAALQAFAAKTALDVDKHLVAIKALDKSPADDVTHPAN
jgi:putative membrane protein